LSVNPGKSLIRAKNSNVLPVYKVRSGSKAGCIWSEVMPYFPAEAGHRRWGERSYDEQLTSNQRLSADLTDDYSGAVDGFVACGNLRFFPMKLTTRGHYSVKALLDLALQPAGQAVSVNTIASRQELPPPYLEKLLIQLRRAGIVESVRGAQGGYRLARSPGKITLGQVLEAVGEIADPLPHHEPQANQAEDWVTYAVWKRLSQKLRESLYKISLEDLYYDARSWQAAQGEDTNFVV
jgi:Rrf2 family iron-sulfur cluster assembly transcriptional regulator